MKWELSELQEAVGELAGGILKDAEDPWSALVEAELLGLESMEDIAALLVEVGKAGAPVPVFETMVLGAPIVRSGKHTEGTILTAGLVEANSRNPRRPLTRAEGGRLYGEKICVPAADRAEQIVVPAKDGVYVARMEDCEVENQQGTDDRFLGQVTFNGAPAERLGGSELMDWWLPRVDVGVCALLLGLSKTALQLTASYVRKRKQFGRPVGAFQAVQQRAADAWIQTQAMEVTMWQAAWRVEQGLPSDRECAIARYFASEGSHFICASAQHLHGGFGFDRDYELHRYFLAAKQHEFLLGGANGQLERLGRWLAGSSV
jgi:3-oxocholest-4-en-26-oyl-CoA dehydrogenase beta subunit